MWKGYIIDEPHILAQNHHPIAAFKTVIRISSSTFLINGRLPQLQKLLNGWFGLTVVELLKKL